MDTSEPRHSGTCLQNGNPETPERDAEEPQRPGNPDSPGTGHRGNNFVPESGHGESGPGLLSSCSGSGLAAGRRSIPSGAALSAHSGGTGWAARWRDLGDNPTPCVRVLTELWAGVPEPPSEHPNVWAASIQDSQFLRLAHASFPSSHQTAPPRRFQTDSVLFIYFS